MNDAYFCTKIPKTYQMLSHGNIPNVSIGSFDPSLSLMTHQGCLVMVCMQI